MIIFYFVHHAGLYKPMNTHENLNINHAGLCKPMNTRDVSYTLYRMGPYMPMDIHDNFVPEIQILYIQSVQCVVTLLFFECVC
jgi:hypothetical protein